MHTGHVGPEDKVVLIDDLIATGGTMMAGIRLMERVGANVLEAACVLELPLLGGKAKVEEKHKVPLFTIIERDVL